MKDLKGYEKRLIIGFLEDLSDYMGNEGCNDWHMPLSMTAEEKAELLEDYKELIEEPDFEGDTLIDHIIVEIMGNKLKETL